MKITKYLSKLTLLTFAVLLIFAVSAQAQRKRTTKRSTTPRTTATTTPAANTLEVKQGAQKVAVQLKNVTIFLYRLGGIATGIEDADKEAKAGKLSRAATDKNAQFKQAVIQSIRNLRAGLAALEVEFRTKPALRNYLVQIQGITDLSGQSEDLAATGRFNDSGKALITVVEKLADTLTAMP